MTSYRQRVIRADGRTLNVVQHRGDLSNCVTGCCCGRTECGDPEVPIDVDKEELTRAKSARKSISPRVDASFPACLPMSPASPSIDDPSGAIS